MPRGLIANPWGEVFDVTWIGWPARTGFLTSSPSPEIAIGRKLAPSPDLGPSALDAPLPAEPQAAAESAVL